MQFLLKSVLAELSIRNITWLSEADVILVQKMSMVAKETQCGIAVLPYMLDDADVFLLLLHYYVKQSLTSLAIGATVAIIFLNIWYKFWSDT